MMSQFFGELTGERNQFGIQEMADKEGVSMNQFITLAVSEKVSTLLTIDYLKERARRGDLEIFEGLLEKVPDKEPEEYDKI